MDSILSIQSHVVYGYVGNKASTYPLQSIGFDVWPINTVQFSNHTGYPQYTGQVFNAEHIENLVNGILKLSKIDRCKAILSGYMGSIEICKAVANTVQKLKKSNKDILYLCDPVIGNSNCYVHSDVLTFFKSNLCADIITPNQYEAETLSGITIESKDTLVKVMNYFHSADIKVVVITGVKFSKCDSLKVFASNGKKLFCSETQEYHFQKPVNGTGDLFSSTFLGAYLKYNDIEYALKFAIYCLEQALKITSQKNEQELQVLSVDYRNNLKMVKQKDKKIYLNITQSNI